MQLQNDGKLPEGIIFSDLAKQCEPAAAITKEYVLDKWTSVPYETAAVSGTAVSAFETMSPESIVLDPQLTGWYKIYVSLLDKPGNRAFLRLTDDEAQSSLCVGNETFCSTWWKWERFQENFWKCADMTGQTIEISKRTGPGTGFLCLGWFRFVPMSQAEVEELKAERERTDTKNLFATCDMYSVVEFQSPRKTEEWYTIIENMKHSDVEILSLDEDIVPDDFEDKEHGPQFAFVSNTRKALHLGMLQKKRSLYEGLIDYGHKKDLKIYLSKRMGAKLGASYPYDGEYVDLEFGRGHMDLRCKNRDGMWVDSLSFAYPEVQDYMISSFACIAQLDCDGITLIYTRGIPYILFEEPFLEAFSQKHPGVNPCELPLSDVRVYGTHCDIMNDFMRRVKQSLDAECKRLGRKPIAVHVCVGSSLKDNKFYGIDVETWSKEGLIDSFSAYPLSLTEHLDGLMQADNPELIDLAKYTKAVRESFHKVIHRDVEHMWHIELDAAREYVALAKKYNIKVYFDLLDRLKPSEEYVEDARKFIDCGAENFMLWDCDIRAEVKAEWETASRLGHIEELKDGTFAHRPATLYRILSINGKNISLYNPSWFG